MFTFFCDIFNGNQANLSVVYFDENTTETDELASIHNNKNYYETDSITEAIKYFNLYTEDGILKAYTKEEVALDNMGINSEDAPEFREKINLLLQNLDDECNK